MSDTLWCMVWAIYENHPRTPPQFCSLHPNEEKMEQFTERYWAGMPSGTPDAFAAPVPTILPYQCRVDPVTYRRVMESDKGMWCASMVQNTMDAVSLIVQDDLTSLERGMMPAS